MGRSPCCKKVGLNKGPWTEAEDAILSAYIKVHGEGNWRLLPKSAGLMRCGKSCRLRWINYLRPDLKRGNISPDEDELIIKLHSLLGNRWSLIAGRIPGRTDNEIKNYWNTHLKRKFGNMGVDPSNHRLFPTPTSSTPNSSSDDFTNGDNGRDPQCSTDFDQGADSHNRSPTTSLTPGRHSTDFDHGASLSNFNLSDYPLSQRDGSASEPGSRMCVQFYPDNGLEENCYRPPILEGISKEALEESQSHSPESVLSYADMIQFVESHADWSIGSKEQLQPIEAHIPFFDCTEAASNSVDTHFPPEFHKDLTASPLWTSLSLFDNF